MKYFDCYNKLDFKTSYPMGRDYFSTFRYNVQIDPQDYRLNGQRHFNQQNQRNGLEPINKKQTYFTIKHDVR